MSRRMSGSNEAAPTPAPTEPAAKSAPAEPPSPAHGHGPTKLFPLAVGALGIVYGDIGTSPLYAMAECFSKDANGITKEHSLVVSHDSVMGLLSLFFWSLTMVVTVKYLTFIMRAHNRGEGGIFALLALIPAKATSRIRGGVVLAALFGAALLYGDGVITPAISVLSAVEGLGVATHTFDRWVVPLTLVILLALFLVQKRGTDTIGKFFGPLMVVWFFVIGGLGLAGIIHNPEILKAVSPTYAVKVFEADPGRAFKVLGSVVLCITGGEALYADMGHFGAKPIRLSWFVLVLPALMLNYFGQGAYLLEHGWVEKPFWAIVPEVMLYPMVFLATAATVIASQALISGAFSLTRQAVQLGYMPRVTIVHTSAVNEGQIYIPEVNIALMVSCLSLVLVFRESTALAAAYGIAVTGTMGITSLVYFVVTMQNWKWSVWKALPLLVLFLAFDLPFFAANALKFFEGGWFPIAVGISMFALMTTWKRGRAELALRFNQSVMPLSALLEDLEATKPHRVPDRSTAATHQAAPRGEGQPGHGTPHHEGAREESRRSPADRRAVPR